MIELQDVTLHSGAFSLSAIRMFVPAGTYAVLMGGTGQGKTTILEAICGLKPVAAMRTDPRAEWSLATKDQPLHAYSGCGR